MPHRHGYNTLDRYVTERLTLHVSVLDSSSTWTTWPPSTLVQTRLQTPRPLINRETPSPSTYIEYSMASASARSIFCQTTIKPAETPRLRSSEASPEIGAKVLLQPRVCTLRSFGGDRGAVVKTDGGDQVSRFFETLSDYVDSSKKSHDFEIVSGRLAMIVFAATVGVELVTGDSVFRKLDMQGIEEGAGAGLAAVISAAIFAWFSSNRSRVGRIFSIGCNIFIDSVIDHVIDGLFYETDTNFDEDEKRNPL